MEQGLTQNFLKGVFVTKSLSFKTYFTNMKEKHNLNVGVHNYTLKRGY